MKFPSGSMPNSAAARKQESLIQQQVDNDMQQQSGVSNPCIEHLILFLSRILPCSESVLRRLIWVVGWGWKAAPVALYQSFNFDHWRGGSDAQRSGSISTTSTRATWTDLRSWWQKTVAVPSALGFYYFLYDYVSQPLVEAFGCCQNYWIFVSLCVGILVLHFILGVAVHLCETRREEQKEQEQQYQHDQEDNIKSPTASSQQPSWTELDHKQHQSSDSMATTPSSSLSPNQAKKKRSFWPFRKSKKQPQTDGSTADTALV